MKPGDLVKGKSYDPNFLGAAFAPMTGIIIKNSKRTNHWDDKLYQWWWILTEDGELIEEVETYLELIQ